MFLNALIRKILGNIYWRFACSPMPQAYHDGLRDVLGLTRSLVRLRHTTIAAIRTNTRKQFEHYTSSAANVDYAVTNVIRCRPT